MSDIIPRNKVIPVQARRRDPEPPMIQIPGADPIPAPPTQPGVTQNIIYVNIPGPQSPAPQSPQPAPLAPAANPPQEIHVHNTHVHNYARRRGQRLGSSFFGTLGLMLGGASMAAAYMPVTLSYAKIITEAGAASSALGLLSAIAFGRVGRGLPFFALVVCGAGFGMWAKNSGLLPGVPGFEVVTAPQHSTAAPATVAPSGATPAPADKPTANQPAPDATRLHDHTIFGDGQGTWVKPSAPASPSLPATPRVTPLSPAPIDLATAKTNLELARTTAAARLGLDYVGAKQAADTAQSEYDQAKIADAPGSPDLIAASEKHLQAQSQLNEIVAKLHSDPGVAAAEASVKAAR
jgi:hypothetical protein